MATKNHVDNSVAERRLRPIYDWLDCGNNKRALQEADKLLKKQPSFQCAKVLKGLALLRLGKEKECEELVSAVHAEVPYNDATLQAMTICYRELHKPESICDLYAAAAKKDPANEELLTHLFMAYVRVGDYKKQQQTAMALYKIAPKNPYYFWAVMSIVMQAHTSKPELKCSVVLPLAERMVDKIIQEDKIEAEQEVELYLMILEMQGKLDEALKVLEGPLGEKLQSCISIPVKKVQLLIKLKRWAKANVMLKQLLKDDMDCWLYYKDYLDTVFHLIDKTDTVEEDEEIIKNADKTIADCAGFLSNIQEDNQQLSHRLRGPYLAHLEFYSRLADRGDVTDVQLGDLVELFMLYFHEFGAKQCCLSDLKSYLKLLSETQVADFLDQVFKVVQLNKDQQPTSTQQMLRFISNLQLSRFLGFHENLDYDSKLKLVVCLMHYYEHGLSFNEGMLPTDLGLNDPYALLAAHVLYDTWLETNDLLYIRDAIVVLENALSHSVSNYQIKLLLLKFYNLIGACKSGCRIYELLDIKHLQHDTLGYFQLWPLLSTGQFTVAWQLFNSTLKFFTASCRESSDHLTISYKYGSFLKISEFVEFRDRLNNSLHYASVQVEKPLMDIFHATSHDHTLQLVEQTLVTPYFKVNWNKLEDNRDFTTLWTASPSGRRITKELIKQSYDTEVDLLRFRLLILQIIMCSVQLSSDISSDVKNSRDADLSNTQTRDNNCTVNENELKNLIDELLRIYDSLLKSPHPKFPRNIIEGPPESRLDSYINSYMVPIIHSLFIVANGIYHSKGCSDLHKKNNLKNGDVNLTNGCQHDCTNSSVSENDKIGNLSTLSDINSLENSGENSWRNCDIYNYYKASVIAASMISNITTKLLNKTKEVNSSDCFNGRLETINEITLTLEMVCFTTIVCGIVHSLVKSVKTTQVKKHKKKKDENLLNELGKTSGESKRQLESVQFLISTTLKSVEQLASVINHLEGVWLVDSLTSKTSVLNIKDTLQSPLNEEINDSHTNSLLEVSSVLRRKHRYLNELKL